MSCPPRRPNVLVITTHDLGRFLPSYGVSTVVAPALTELSATGVQCDQSFCCAPQCSPARAALFTGRYPHANGVMGLAHGHFAWDLARGEQHLAALLHAAGYWTCGMGVLHECHTHADRGWAHLPASRAKPATGRAQEAVAYQRQHWDRQQPFYLQLGFFEPHRPWGDQVADSQGVTVPPFLRETPAARAEFAHFQGLIRELDGGVRVLLDWLSADGLADDTLVLFTADHGIPFPRAKCSLYDPGLEVAMLWRWPAGGVAGGRRYQDLVSHLDVLPTLLELLALPRSPTNPLHGQSLAPALRGQPQRAAEAVFGEMTYHAYYDPMRCIRTRTHKLIAFFSTCKAYMDPSQLYHPPCAPVVPADPANSFHQHLELYDLVADPLEHHNLAADPAHASVLAALAQRLLAWMTDTGDPLLHGAITPPMHATTMARLRQAVPPASS